MLAIIRIVGKALATVATEKWPFIRVDALMPLQVPRTLNKDFQLSEVTGKSGSFPPESICHKTGSDNSHSIAEHEERLPLMKSRLAWLRQREGRDCRRQVAVDSTVRMTRVNRG